MAAIAAAFVTESILHQITTGKWRDLSSAYISGISAGILVRSPLVWPFALCAAISIASKYVLSFIIRLAAETRNVQSLLVLYEA